ncbi:hypothetical protein [uncultured Jatrophihabitans sp.]|uniref:hypothetical protein n=1 Tax=uncultured Jatrophihabitans sp. TaxID=1610747 RepID=UPI0035CBA2B4
MNTLTLQRNCGVALAVGSVLAAAAIALEAVTDPDDADRAPHYIHGLAVPVALLLLGGVLVLLVGLVGLAVRIQTIRGRGTAWVAAVGLGLTVAEVPHTILDMTAIPVLFDRLPHAQARDLVDNHIDSLPGALSGIGILPLLIGSVLLARACWNGEIVPRWSPRWAIALLVVAVGTLPLSGLAWWFPHGPVLLYVGIAGYGIGLVRAVATADAQPTQRRTADAANS